MTDVVQGSAIYLRRTFEPASILARRCKAMGLRWVAIGAVWQDGASASRFLNVPMRCQELARAMRDVGIVPYVWGYPWLGGEAVFIDRMVECAGSEPQYLLDPELGMNPSRDPNSMTAPNASAASLVNGLRVRGAKVVGLSTFGGIPSWFPLRAFLKAGVDFAGGQTYTADDSIDVSVKSFASEIALTGSTAQLVPNFGLYAKGGPQSYRSKTPDELRAHLSVFAGEPIKAAIGWAENFLTPDLEPAVAEFSAKLGAVP